MAGLAVCAPRVRAALYSICPVPLLHQVRVADAKVITGIRSMLTALQSKYLNLAFNDLPAEVACWA